MSGPAILILAAGAARRMAGVDKLLQPVGGQPQLRRIALAALATGSPVIVTLPTEAAARQQVLADLPVRIVAVPDAGEGMAASIRRGALAAGEGGALMILPADLPGLTVADLALLLDSHQADPTLILRGASGEQPGHPVLIPADLVPALQGLAGDEGARGLLQGQDQRLRLLALPGDHATLDLDTPEAWADWQAKGAVPAYDHPLLRDPLTAALVDAQDCVLAVITDVIGASYRRTGTLMAFFPDGRYVGDLTNGCIESDVALQAAACLESGTPLRLRYGLGSPFFDIRLPCGGGLDLALYPRPDRTALADIARRRAGRQTFALRFDEAGRLGTAERAETGWDGAAFGVKMLPDIAFVIFGEGTEAETFARLVQAAGYPHRLVTPSRRSFETAQRAGCLASLRGGRDLAEGIAFDARTAIVTFFHDHDREVPILAAALASPALYVGAQGSKRVAARRQEQLAAAGVAPAALARLHAPIGLIPSARDARTLAVSVLAEVVALAETARSG